MKKIGIIDYGSGNFTSVKNAFESILVETITIKTVADVEAATHIVLPGVGTFAAAMRKINEMGIVDELYKQIIANTKPFLGICVGMQVLADFGTEFERCAGLGWITGITDRVKTDCRLPHVGWNNLRIVDRGNPLLIGLDDQSDFYFVHSFHFTPIESRHISAVCEYGTDIVAAVMKDNIYGVQFHPEKSQKNGLRILKNFTKIS
ncbi:MAG: imidazole glycerol phosphate synthase subunit HisH [Negativicutes bacterium]